VGTPRCLCKQEVGNGEFLEQIVPFGELYTQNEMVVLPGDVNGHVGIVMFVILRCMMFMGMELGMLMAPGFGDFADGLNLVICNTLFMKQELKLVTYVVDSVKSTVDCYCTTGDKAKVHNVIVIINEECVPKHRLKNACTKAEGQKHVRNTKTRSDLR